MGFISTPILFYNGKTWTDILLKTYKILNDLSLNFLCLTFRIWTCCPKVILFWDSGSLQVHHHLLHMKLIFIDHVSSQSSHWGNRLTTSRPPRDFQVWSWRTLTILSKLTSRTPSFYLNGISEDEWRDIFKVVRNTDYTWLTLTVKSMWI